VLRLATAFDSSAGIRSRLHESGIAKRLGVILKTFGQQRYSSAGPEIRRIGGASP
jgi:hypothetical protein